MLWDTHMHTYFSGDSNADPEDMIQKSMELGLDGICITDHLDIDFPEKEGFVLIDLEKYAADILRLKEKYKDRFPVRFGIEMGLQPHLAGTHHDILNTYDFDFVIGSTHAVHGEDIYFPEFYMNRPEEECYMEYFETVLENIRAFDEYDVYGHLDYVVRYGPNRNKYYSYERYKDVIDEILNLLIDKGRGIEINMSGFKYGLGHPNPTEDIIRRYHALGGEIITVGSDAHSPEQIAWDFEKIPGILKDCGFSYYTVFRDRKPEFIKL